MAAEPACSTASADPTAAPAATTPPLVWDGALRLFHWSLALCFGVSWLTAELGVEYTEWHMRSGYAILGLLMFRLLWGLLGNRFARFAALLPRPRRILAYARTLPDRSAPASAGHSPLAVLAVWTLLALLAIQAGSGLFTTDDIIYSGPYQGAVSAATSDWMTDLHHSNFDWLRLMVGAHLAAVLFYALYKRQNLVRPMVSGRNPLLAAAQAASPTPWWR
ncbi:MAG: cytochrome b/b6 domain-containing protein, partial [Pseudomonadota bacterium]